MSGRMKHMQRSHYSYHTNKAIFNTFNRRTYIKKAEKERVSMIEKLGQQIKALFNKKQKKGDEK